MTPLFFKVGRRYREASRQEVCEAAAQYEPPIIGLKIRTPADTEAYLKSQIGHLEHEAFCVVYLDNQHRVIHFDQLFRGTIDGTAVYPREIVKEALRHNAAAVILAHNHPSGTAEPSQADERITKRLQAALEMIDVRVLDHIIIGTEQNISFATRGLL